MGYLQPTALDATLNELINIYEFISKVDIVVQLRKRTQDIITKRFICTNSDNKLHSFHITDI